MKSNIASRQGIRPNILSNSHHICTGPPISNYDQLFIRAFSSMTDSSLIAENFQPDLCPSFSFVDFGIASDEIILTEPSTALSAAVAANLPTPINLSKFCLLCSSKLSMITACPPCSEKPLPSDFGFLDLLCPLHLRPWIARFYLVLKDLTLNPVVKIYYAVSREKKRQGLFCGEYFGFSLCGHISNFSLDDWDYHYNGLWNSSNTQ